MLVDLHQHVWTMPLVDALSRRRSHPRVVWIEGEPLLEMADEGPHLIELAAEAPSRRRAILDADGVDRAVVAISSPIGIEALPRDQADPLIATHLDGVQALGPRFAAWGPIALDQLEPDDVDRVLDRGCIGVSLPAGAIATPHRIDAIGPVLARVCARGAPLFVHPGPADSPSDLRRHATEDTSSWWASMTGYVSQMQAAWLSFVTRGRADHPRLMVVFAMLAGGAPLLSERLATRGGPQVYVGDPRTFYDTSSFGPSAITGISRLVGADQLVYGSDRPVVEPIRVHRDVRLQENGARLLTAAESRV